MTRLYWFIIRGTLIALTALTLPRCARVSPATVRLSAEVGARISETERLHQLALQRYFALEREKIEQFLREEWEPLFLKNFLGNSRIVQDLQNVSQFKEAERQNITKAIEEYLDDKSEAAEAATKLLGQLNKSRKEEPAVIRTVLNTYVEDNRLDAAVLHISSLLGTDEPAQMIFEFTQAAHEQMELQRKEMLEPLYEAERTAVAELSASYSELTAGQSAITGRLEAASRITAEQDRLLEALHAKDFSEKTRKQLAKVSQVVADAVAKAQKVLPEEGREAPNKAAVTLRDELKKLSSIEE